MEVTGLGVQPGHRSRWVGVIRKGFLEEVGGWGRCDRAGVADGQMGRKVHIVPKSGPTPLGMAVILIRSETLGRLLWFLGSPFSHL